MRLVLRGTPAAPGFTIGPMWRFRPAAPASMAADADLAGAARETAADLRRLADRLRGVGRPDEAAILDAQALMARDPAFIDGALALAAAGHAPTEAVLAAGEALAGQLDELDDELFRARAADVRDVAARVARTLGGEVVELPGVASIAVAADLPPSLTAEIPDGLLIGIALEGGSRTAHAVILARALGIPAVTGVHGILEALDAPRDGAADGPIVLVDGTAGVVIVDPDETDRAQTARPVPIARPTPILGRLGSGERVGLLVNVGSPDEAERAAAAGAQGIGLFRTEFLFMRRLHAPTEAEQVAAYRRALRAFGPGHPLVIRLLDVGGDKEIPYLALPAESNPFLGVRGIRLAYSDRTLLVTQIRAIARAARLEGVTASVMAPMIATLADVELFADLVAEAEQGASPDAATAVSLRVGIMVEVPAAALLARTLAPHVSFMSIGTNDLAQYTLAADRTSAALDALQDPLHPAVLSLVAETVRAADEASIPVAVCGEAAGDPEAAAVLVGLGVGELSMAPASLAEIDTMLAGLDLVALRELAAASLAAPDAATVRGLAARVLHSAAPRT